MVKSIDQINSLYGKVPPQAIDLEEAVLGALILENDAYDKVCDIISVRSFYKEEHQKIYEVIEELHKSDKRTDLMIITNELRNKGLIEQIGGIMVIMQLSSKVANAAHIEFHARIIKQKFVQREIIRISTQIQTLAYDDTQDVSDLLTLMENELDLLNNGMNGSDEGRTSKEVAKSAIKEIEQDYLKYKSGKLSGIPTGFYELDKATGGWKSPNFIILAARPGVGKTSLMLKFAVVAAKAGFWVNLYGYEMLSEDLFRIILSGEANINRTNLRDGKLSECDLNSINNAVGKLEDLKILWYDKSDIKSGKIKTNTKKNVKDGRCDIVMADYLQIIPPEEEKTVREQQISKISRNLKQITTINKIPVMALAQLNRDIEKRSSPEPILADLRESGSLEQDADIIIFPYVDEQTMRLKIAKHRRGKRGDFEIKANEDMTRFWDECEYQDNDIPVNTGQFKPNTSFYEQDDKGEFIPF